MYAAHTQPANRGNRSYKSLSEEQKRCKDKDISLLYFFGLSLRKTSKFMSLFQEISHESVRLYYHRLKKVIRLPEKKERKLIAIDETRLKLENRQIFVWSARDVQTGEILFVWASDGRSSFHAYVFLKEVLKRCKNKPEVVVDRGFWYI